MTERERGNYAHAIDQAIHTLEQVAVGLVNGGDLNRAEELLRTLHPVRELSRSLTA